MAHPTGSVRLSAPVGVGSPDDTFGTHYDTLGIGGYRSVADEDAIKSIKAARRTKGMLVRNNTNTKIYIYISDDGTTDNTVTNATDSTYNTVTTGWKELQLGSGSGSGTLTSVTLTQGDQIKISKTGTSTDPIFTFSLDTIPTTKGGTNITNYAVGDILYSNTTDSLAKLTKPSDTSILSMNSSGVPSWLATSTFEVPLTFENGLTRNSNTIKLGGELTADTTIALTTKKLRFSSTETSGVTIFDIYSTDTTLLDLKSNGILPNFFSTKTISTPGSNSGSISLRSSILPLDATNTQTYTTTTVVKGDNTINISNFATGNYFAGEILNYTIDQHTIVLPQKSGNQDNNGIGNSSSTVNMFRYLLTNSIWKAASGGSGTGYTNGTWELARLYSTGLSSNTSGTSNGSRIVSAGVTNFTLANPGHASVFRIIVGDKTLGNDSLTLGYDSVTFPTADGVGAVGVSAYSGQTLYFGITSNTYTTPTSSPGTMTSYLTISSNNVSLPDSGTATGPTNTNASSTGWTQTPVTAIVGTQSRSLNWRVRTHSGKASVFNAGTSLYSFGRNITLNTVTKAYPHYSTLSGNVYDFRQRWLLFTYNPGPTANNNPGITYPDFYNASSKLLDGSVSGNPVRALDILSGDYSTDGTTSLGGQVAVGISLGSGEVPSAKVTIGASTTTQAALRFYSGSAPTSPQNGDMWFDGTNLKIQIGGTTKTITVTS